MADNYNTLVLMFGQGNAFGGTEVDYDKFMEEFRKDYSRQIALTAEQLKNIMNGKDVAGKGEQLSEAVKITLEKRLSKTIEKNRDVYGSKSHLISPEILTLLKTYQESGELPKPDPEVIEAVSGESETPDSAAGEPMEEEPATEEAPAIEEEPVIEDAPAIEEETAIEEPAIEEAPVIEETPREIGTEYLKYGDLSELTERYGDSENTYVRELLSALANYEEIIEMCRVEKIRDAVFTVKNAAKACAAEGADEAFARFAAKVEKMFTIEEDSVPALVKWCVMQGKVRQAAEVYAELMPEYFFDEKIIYYEDFRESRKNDGSYSDRVIDARKQEKSKRNLKYFWLNEMLWKNLSKKLFLNVDKPILEQDGVNARKFKMIFREIKELQETKKNRVQVENLPEDVREMFEIIARGGYISPVLNTAKKVCNYFFNYEATGTAGSVQKSYHELSLILLSNKEFTEEYFGEESVQIVIFTPASVLMNKEQTDVKSSLSVTKLEKALRTYQRVKEQASLAGQAAGSREKSMSRGELRELLLGAVE